MTGEILTAGDIGRLKAASSVTGATDRIPIYQSGTLKYATPDQIALGQDAVVGPASATDNAIALFDGTTGELVKNSVVTVVAGAVAGVTTLTATSTLQGSDLIATNITTASSSQTLTNNGIARLGGSSVLTVFLQPPVAGCFKWLRSLSTIAHTVTSSAAFIGTTAATTITFSAPTGLVLRGESSIQWGIYGRDSTGYATT